MIALRGSSLSEDVPRVADRIQTLRIVPEGEAFDVVRVHVHGEVHDFFCDGVSVLVLAVNTHIAECFDLRPTACLPSDLESTKMLLRDEGEVEGWKRLRVRCAVLHLNNLRLLIVNYFSVQGHLRSIRIGVCSAIGINVARPGRLLAWREEPCPIGRTHMCLRERGGSVHAEE